MENKRHTIELAEIFRDHGDSFSQQHTLCSNQLQAMHAITSCRTSVLGGHINQCDHCGHTSQAYCSCRNRHCPKCQYIKQKQWVDKVKTNLPPTRYFHLVFTLPQCLNKLLYINQQEGYTILFKAAAESLKKVALMPNLLGAETGAVAILHTWGQALTYHPHIHMIVPAGGISTDGMEWMQTPANFLLPVKVIARLFRGIFCRMLKKHWDDKIIIPDDWAHKGYDQVKTFLYKNKWNVYAKKSFASPDKVVEYLGNYTYRVAISNSRITQYDGDKVTFRYKDYNTGITNRTMTLPVQEFIRRFMQHVLPCGFYKIRYYGIFAATNAISKLGLAFTLLDHEQHIPSFEGLTAFEVYQKITGTDLWLCPKCKKGRLRAISSLKQREAG